MPSPIYILFALLILGVPFYQSFERLYHASEAHIPRQIKFTTQSAVRSSTAIQRFCDLFVTRRSLATTVFLCPVHTVGGGGVFGAVLTGFWNAEDRAAVKRLHGSVM